MLAVDFYGEHRRYVHVLGTWQEVSMFLLCQADLLLICFAKSPIFCTILCSRIYYLFLIYIYNWHIVTISFGHVRLANYGKGMYNCQEASTKSIFKNCIGLACHQELSGNKLFTHLNQPWITLYFNVNFWPTLESICKTINLSGPYLLSKW